MSSAVAADATLQQLASQHEVGLTQVVTGTPHGDVVYHLQVGNGVAALASGDADVISAFSSDGRIAADNLVVLTDPRRALPGYDAVLLVSRRSADNSRFLAAIRPMVGRIGVDQMRQANYAVDRTDGKQSPEAAARALGCATGLGPCLQ